MTPASPARAPAARTGPDARAGAFVRLEGATAASNLPVLYAVFFVLGVAAVLVLSLRGTFRPARQAPDPGRAPTLFALVAEGLRWYWGHRLVRVLGALAGVANLAAAFAVLPAVNNRTTAAARAEA